MEINAETNNNYMTTSYIIKFCHPYDGRSLYISHVQEYNGHVITAVTFKPKWAIKLSNRSLIRKVCNRIAIIWAIKEGTNFKAIPQIIPVYE